MFNTKNYRPVMLALLLFSGAFTACNNKETPEPVLPLEAVVVRDIPADPTRIDPNTGRPVGGTNRFTLYSLRDNAIVANTDSATTKWDIGFRGTSIIVNGGTIRTGQGGAAIHTGLFDEVSAIAETVEFKGDNSAADLAIPAASGQGWYNYNPQNHLVSPIPGRVLLIRTANGHFAKVEILSYYKGAPANPNATTDVSRHYTFRFMYQPNGSRKFN